MRGLPIQLCAVALLSGMGFATRAAGAADEYANIHRVGIISAIGDSIDMAEVGSTVFGNAGYTLSTVDWHLDEAVTRQVADAIKQRFTIVPVTADAFSITGKRDTEDMTGFVRSLPPSNNVDAYIIVYKFLCPEQCAGTPFALWGLGYVHHKSFFGPPQDLLFAYYRVAVVDAKSGKTLDFGTGNLGKSFLGLDLPIAAIDSVAWSETPATLTVAQKDTIKATMIFMIQSSLNNALKSAKLTPP